MAPFSNYISFLFLTTLLLPLQINARDSQFFSKVTHFNNNNNVKDTQLPYNEGPVNKPEQQPVFIPETENSYGLYGHGSAQHPSTTTTNAAPYTTTTTYQPHKTEFEDTSKYPDNKYYNYKKDAYNTDQNEFSNTKTEFEDTSKYPDNKYYNKDAYNTNHNEFSNTRTKLTGTGYSNVNKNNYYNKDAHRGNENELSDTKYTEGGYNTVGKQNNKEKYYYNNNPTNDRHSYNSNAANNRYNGERQGMSDTRFLEGGKYFYDVNYEKYNPTLYGDSSREVSTDNWYNNRGNYYGNNNAYQNQEEFEDDKDDFEP